MTFLILSLPRSRSFWLSQFLSYRGTEVGHDLLVESKSIASFEDSLKKVAGSCETGAMLGWKLLVARHPSWCYVVVHRRPEAVRESLAAKGITLPDGFLEERFAMLEAFSRVRGVLTVDYEDLSRASVCGEVFEFCLRRPFDQEWWQELAVMNLQINLVERMIRLQGRAQALSALNSEVLTATAKLGSQQCLRLN